MTDALCLPNLRAASVEEQQFWEKEYDIPRFPNKDAFQKWLADDSTRHCVYSFIEGQDPTQRVKRENPPLRVRGLILDYDAVFDDHEVQTFVTESLESDYPVNLLGRSYSGGIHAVWLFEEPVVILGIDSIKRFLKLASRRVNGPRLARGLDLGFEDPYKYYTVGGVWQRVHATPIPLNVASYWAFESTTPKELKTRGIELPLDLVAKRVEEKFPGRWSGEFAEGVRGVRFWDPTADNPTAAVVRSTGMQCFTGHQPFYTWAELFGTKFVEQFVADRIGPVVSQYYYDGKVYWTEVNGVPRDMGQTDVTRALKIRHGLSAKVPKGQEHSELEKALDKISEENRVTAAVPLVFNYRRAVRMGRELVYNTATVQPMKMASDPVEWGENFPELALWLETMFGETQFPYFLSWLSRFYRGAHDGNVQSGHALFIVGDPDTGKTLLSTKYLSSMFGGHALPAEYLLGHEKFNGAHLSKGLWCLDDEVGEADKVKFSSRLKQYVANHAFYYSEKFVKGAQVEWKGRIVTSLNSDPQSLQILPDLDMNILDKIMIFRVSKSPEISFTPGLIMTMYLQLPYLCRYVYDYVVPDELRGGSRFGVKAYINPQVHSDTMLDNYSTQIVELIDLMFTKHPFDPDEPQYVEGSTTEIMERFTSVSQGVTRYLRMPNLNRQLMTLSSKGHPQVELVQGGGRRVWRLYPRKDV